MATRFNAEVAEICVKGHRGEAFSAKLRANLGVLGVKEIFSELRGALRRVRRRFRTAVASAARPHFPEPYPGSRTGVAPGSDIVWTSFSERRLPAVNSHLLVRQLDEYGDRAAPVLRRRPRLRGGLCRHSYG